jgi:hypothetical protein
VTNSDYITSALQLLGVLSESETPSAEQGSQGLTVLNDMMAEWEAAGISIGWKVSSSTTDTIDFHPAFRTAVRTNLAMHLAPYYERQPSAMLVALSQDSYGVLLQDAMNDKIESLPQFHLPRSEGGQGVFNMSSGNVE